MVDFALIPKLGLPYLAQGQDTPVLFQPPVGATTTPAVVTGIWPSQQQGQQNTTFDTFFNMIVDLEGTTFTEETINGQKSGSQYGITPNFITTVIKDDRAKTLVDTLNAGKLTRSDAKIIYKAMWDILGVNEKPSSVQLMYADAAVSHGINGAQRLYSQASNKKNQLPGETLQQSFRRHRIGAYMGQEWIPNDDRKTAASEYAALEAWLNRLATVEQTAGQLLKSKNSTIDQMTLDRTEADDVWFRRSAWDSSVVQLLKTQFPEGPITIPMLSVRLYKPNVVQVGNWQSNIDLIREQIGDQFGITPSRLALLNPGLHDLKKSRGADKSFYRFMVPLTTVTVKSSDTWASLGNRCRLSEDDLKAINRHVLPKGVLKSGQSIIVPNLLTDKSYTNLSSTYTGAASNQDFNIESLKGICKTYHLSSNTNKSEGVTKAINALMFDHKMPSKPVARPTLSSYEQTLYEHLKALSLKTNDFSKIRSIASETVK